MKVMFVLGARPQFIKSAPVIHELLTKSNVTLQLVHSGQHYDQQLSQVFFDEFRLPKPILNLQVGSGSHAAQTARATIGVEQSILQAKPNLVLVIGDTNTTLAGALSASKLRVPVGHVEAGARSQDFLMAEEINRRVTDHVSSLLFAPTRTTAQNLYREGIPSQNVHLVGDTIVDALKGVLPMASIAQSRLLSKLKVEPREYVLVTAHRAENVDELRCLKSLVTSLVYISRRIKIIFLMHPRVKLRLTKFHLLPILKRQQRITLTRPVDYISSICLLDNAAAVLTDSGGLQKEAFLLGVPCATMRKDTEWPETTVAGANALVGLDSDNILDAITEATDNDAPHTHRLTKTAFGDGKASKRIAKIVATYE